MNTSRLLKQANTVHIRSVSLINAVDNINHTMHAKHYAQNQHITYKQRLALILGQKQRQRKPVHWNTLSIVCCAV